MLKKYLVLAFSTALIIQFSMAQTKAVERKISLGSISNIGLLNGSKESSVSLQTILGAAFKGTFAGIGIGIDYYRFRSVPLFFDLRHEFGKGQRSFFIYGDLGYNHDWLTEKNKETYFSGTSNYKGGIYYDAGIGYKVPFKNRDALLLSAGYSVKKVRNELDAVAFCPFAGPCSAEVEKYNYTMQRVVVKAGWRF